jgi:hypothetical protein
VEDFVKASPVVTCAIALAQCIFSFSASADQVDKFTCHRISGGPMSAFVMTVNLSTKDIDIPENSGLLPMPDSVEITNTSIQWGFMRGSAKFDRKTYELNWDATAEYDYLDYIGQLTEEPEADFQGRMQCSPQIGNPPH